MNRKDFSLLYWIDFSAGLNDSHLIVHIKLGRQVYRGLSKELITNILSLACEFVGVALVILVSLTTTTTTKTTYFSFQPIWVAYTVCSLDSVRSH